MKDSCRILRLEFGQSFFSTDLECSHKVWALLAFQTTKLSYHSNYRVVEMLVQIKPINILLQITSHVGKWKRPLLHHITIVKKMYRPSATK